MLTGWKPACRSAVSGSAGITDREWIMNELHASTGRLCPFASVYRSFKDINEFMLSCRPAEKVGAECQHQTLHT